MKKKSPVKKHSASPQWNMKLFYASLHDPQIEKDILSFEKKCADFAAKYDSATKEYVTDENKLKHALGDYEVLSSDTEAKFLLYFYFLRDSDARNMEAAAKSALVESRIHTARNKIVFFEIALGSTSADTQQKFLKSSVLAEYKVFLKRVFDNARHMLSVAEEKIMNLKSIPAQSMWVDGNQRLLNVQTVVWKGKTIPLAEASSIMRTLTKASDRKKLSALIAEALKKVAPFAEAEMNAVVTDKKINDTLRGFKTPYEATVHGYYNDPQVVETLVNVVTKNFKIAHDFYAIKACLLKQKKLLYSDRSLNVGKIKAHYSFEDSFKILVETFEALNPRFADILQKFRTQGQIDATPRIGKAGGAYCWGSYSTPTFVLLNHVGTLDSHTTFAHEMGHAFHTEFSRAQKPFYFSYSTSLAETASTLFEALALEAEYEKLSDKEKVIALHNKINDDVATVFRQIACFNFEKDIHATVAEKGFVTHQELGQLHNKHMSAYLGPAFHLTPDDGYMFVQWSHIRRFFYVYSYAYGQLVSKAMLRRYKKDPKFWKSIEQFLSSGGKDSPENILKEIGIDVASPEFFHEGLEEIKEDIKKLKGLTDLKVL